MKNYLFAALSSNMSAEDKTLFVVPKTDVTAARRIRYSEAFAITGSMANRLVATGVKPGDRVVVQVEKSVESIFLYLACIRVGAVYVPLNTAYTSAELEYFIRDAEPRLIVCSPSLMIDVSDIARRLSVAEIESLGCDGSTGTFLDDALRFDSKFEDVGCCPDDIAAIVYTSGTTGRSKGAMLSHGNLVSNVRTLVEAWQFTSEDVLLHALPIFHSHGLFVAINIALFAGSSVIVLPRFEADLVIPELPRATVMMGVPTFYTRLLKHPGLDRHRMANMRLFVSGSAPLLSETFSAWFSQTGHRILERYGMTETNMNTSNPYLGERVAGTVGKPLADIEVRVVDPTSGIAVPTGEVGMIEIRGPNVFRGYWRMPDKTAAEFRRDGFFISGDLGVFDKNGYLRIVGRSKDLVISGGFNVYPAEVEAEINMLPDVLESAVIGLPHPDFGEGVTAVIVVKREKAHSEEEVIKALEGRLAKFKLPKRVLVADELPRNAMGKVQKNLLRERYKGLFSHIRP